MNIEIKNKDDEYNPLFNGLSKESSKSKELLSFFRDKFTDEVSIILLLKCCSVVSAQLPQKLNLFIVAPPGQFKSVLDREISNIFVPNMVTNLGSDMTIHSLNKHFKGLIPKTCIVINDYTMLIHTKEKRTRLRLEGGLAELISEGKYSYGDFKQTFCLKGQPSMIINMSYEAFNLNKNRMSESTFLDRLMLLSFSVPINIQEDIFLDKTRRLLLNFDEPKFKRNRINKYDTQVFERKIMEIGSHYAIKSMQSYSRTWDLLKALVMSHAYLNSRKYITDDDIMLIKCINNLVGNKFSKEGEILELWIKWKKDRKSFTKTDLADYFHRDTKYINKILFKAKLRGFIDDD
jgi:hypothetical protein